MRCARGRSLLSSIALLNREKSWTVSACVKPSYLDSVTCLDKYSDIGRYQRSVKLIAGLQL